MPDGFRQTGKLNPAGYVPTSPVTARTVQGALNQLAHPKSTIFEKTTAQAAIGTGSNVAVTDLVGLPFPGSPDGTKVYAVNGVITHSTSSDGTIRVNVHSGTNGDATDAVIATAYGATGNVGGTVDKRSLHIPQVRVVPASASVQITISVQTEVSIDIVNVAVESFCWLEQISNA